MAFLSRSPPSTAGVSHQFSLKEHFMSRRSSTSSEGARNGLMMTPGKSTRISCDSARSSSSSAGSGANPGGENHHHGINQHNQRGDELKTDAIKEERAQQQRGLGSVDEDQLLEEHTREMMRNSYVDAPFRVQTNSTAETIDVMTSKRVEASSPSKSRLSVSRTSEDNNRANLNLGNSRMVNVPVNGQRQQQPGAKVSAQNVTAIVLAGGVGESNPMTRKRAISALSVGGSFRLIDFPVAACLKAEFGKVFVLTQYNSRSLNNHVTMTFSKNSSMGRSTTEVCVLPMSATPTRDEWPRGSAAAVRAHLEAQSFDVAIEQGVSSGQGVGLYDKEAYLVCSGEQLHKADFNEMLKAHNDSGAAITMMVQSERCHSSMLEKSHLHHDSNHLKVGLTEVTKKGEKGVVKRLHEKPHFSNIFRELVDKDERHSYHISTGNYIISAEAMKELLLLNPSRERGDYFEFGEHVINQAIERGMKVVVHKHEGYWTPLRSFSEWFQANIEMAKGGSSAELIAYGSDQKLISRARYLPPAKFIGFARVQESLILDGCVVRSGESGSFIESSIVGPTTQIGENVRLKNVIIVGSPEVVAQTVVGDNTEMENVVLDAGASVGKDCVLKCNGNVHVREELRGMIEIVDGVACVLKDAKIPDGTVL
jgi:glucose-1-phosphate adenylyltransferase